MVFGEYLLTASKRGELVIPPASGLVWERCEWRIVSNECGGVTKTRVLLGTEEAWGEDDGALTVTRGVCRISAAGRWKIPVEIERALNAETGEYLWIGCGRYAELTTLARRDAENTTNLLDRLKEIGL